MSRYVLQNLFLLILVLSCKKVKEEKRYCWGAYDHNGNLVSHSLVCGKAEEQARAAYPQYLLYRQDEERACWRVEQPQQKTQYRRGIPESILKHFYLGNATFTKVDCNSFCIWRSYEKSQSKATDLYSPTRVYVETYMADSCSKLYMGRKIIVRETADSLIWREFFEVSS
jgi:hypothetical protein